MNIFQMLTDFFTPAASKTKRIVIAANPTSYVPLKEEDGEFDLARITEEVIAAEKEYREINQERDDLLEKMIKNLLITSAEDRAKREELQLRSEKADTRYRKARDLYDYLKKTSTDLVNALREYAHAGNELQAVKIEFDAVLTLDWNDETQLAKADEVIQRLNKAIVRYSAAKEIVEFINSKPQTSEAKNLNLAFNELTNAEKALGNTSLSTEFNPALTSNQLDSALARIDALASNLESALDRYSKTKASLAATSLSMPVLQSNSASQSRITPLATVFQLVQYGKDLLSDPLIQQMIVNNLASISIAAIAGKLGMFAHDTSSSNTLEAPQPASTMGYHS